MSDRNTFLNGITDFLILSILEKNDCYGYEIRSLLNTKSDGLLDISLTTIYSATYKLEKKGFISEYSTLVGKKRTRVYYHIESPGEEYLIRSRQNYEKTTTGVQRLLESLSKTGETEH